MKRSQVTIKDIAEIAGVSFSTVSRSLNENKQVSEKTRNRIRQIAEDLGFEFNAGARSLITSKTGTVGVVLPENYTKINISTYHSMLMNSLRTYLEKFDVDIIVTCQKSQHNDGNNIKKLITKNKIDGLILQEVEIEQENLDFIKERHVPFVCIHFPPVTVTKDEDVIFDDNYAGGRLVAEHLLERRKTSFLLLAMNEENLEFKLREEGFKDTILKAGYPVKEMKCYSTFEAARDYVEQHLDDIKGCDALFAVNDLMALGAMRSLQDGGYAIPGDIAVVGYDDTEFSRYCNPSLSSVHQPREELAQIACDRLFRQMEYFKTGEEYKTKRISIEPEIIIRESS